MDRLRQRETLLLIVQIDSRNFGSLISVALHLYEIVSFLPKNFDDDFSSRERVLIYTKRYYVCIKLSCENFSVSAPGRSSSEVLIGEVDIPMREDNELEETHEETFAKKCMVDNKAYSHSQTVSDALLYLKRTFFPPSSSYYMYISFYLLISGFLSLCFYNLCMYNVCT